MRPKITYNSAWEPVPLHVADDIIEFFNHALQPSHPLRAYKLFPIAKCCRRYKYMVEEEEPSDLLWVLDLDRKKRVRGKTCYYFKRIETQEELDAMLQADDEWLVQYMKDEGLWQEE